MPVKLSGSTSGFVTLDAPAVAGSNTVTFPANSGTVVTTASSNALPVTAIQATGTPSASTALLGSGAWGSLSGMLIRAPQTLLSGTSYTTPANCTAIYIEGMGGGGAGGGFAGNSGLRAGGGSGIIATKYFTVTPNTIYSYTVGAGGVGTNSNTGPSGGNTTFTVGGVTFSAGGGGGGSTNTPGAAGVSANADFTTYARPGTAGASVTGGSGGSSLLGDGGAGSTTSVSNSATGYGAGGGGGYSSPNTTGAGGNGTSGYLRIWEYT